MHDLEEGLNVIEACVEIFMHEGTPTYPGLETNMAQKIPIPSLQELFHVNIYVLPSVL